MFGNLYESLRKKISNCIKLDLEKITGRYLENGSVLDWWETSWEAIQSSRQKVLVMVEMKRIVLREM